MTTTPNAIIMSQALKAKNAIATAAKTTYNDAAGAVKLCDAGANGSILYGLTCVPRATTAAISAVQLFRSPDNGTTLYFVKSVLSTPAYTFATTTVPPVADFGYSETAPLRLMIGDSLWVGAATALAGGYSFDGQLEDL